MSPFVLGIVFDTHESVGFSLCGLRFLWCTGYRFQYPYFFRCGLGWECGVSLPFVPGIVFDTHESEGEFFCCMEECPLLCRVSFSIPMRARGFLSVVCASSGVPGIVFDTRICEGEGICVMQSSLAQKNS